MDLQDFIIEMEKVNRFLNAVGEVGFQFYSDITGACKNHREFVRAVYREFVDPLAVINAHVSLDNGDKNFTAYYEFDGAPSEFDFVIRKCNQ